MMFLLLVLALGVTDPAMTADWRGAIMYDTDAHGPGVGSLTAKITITKTTINGDFSNPGGASGQIVGTIGSDGAIKATLTLFAGMNDGAGGLAEPERCQGKTTVKGRIYPSGVLSLTTDIIKLDTPSLRALNRDCADMKRVVIRMMLPADH